VKEEKKITCLDFATFAAICIMEDLQYELPDEFLSLSQLQAKSYHELDEFFHVWMLQPSTSHKKAKFGANVSIHQLFKMLSNLRGGSKRPNNGQFLERTRQTKTKLALCWCCLFSDQTTFFKQMWRGRENSVTHKPALLDSSDGRTH
jgi:hypothetical protein